MTAPDPRLDEIQARLDAATPGPWANYGNLGHEVYAVNAHEDEEPGYIAEVVHREPDAHFISNAPGDVAFLLAELRKAHEALARVSDWAGRNKTGYYDEAQDDVVQIIRAAVAAANVDGDDNATR